MALAEPFDDIGLYANAHFDLAEVHYSLGNYCQTIVAFEQTCRPRHRRSPYKRIGAAVFSVVSRRWLVQALAETGAFAAGIARGEEGMRIAETADHPYSLANMCSGVGYLYVCKGEFQQAIPFHARSLELAQVWNFQQQVSFFALNVGSCAGPIRTGSESLALLEQSLEAAELTRAIARSSTNASKLSEVYWRAGRYEDAQALAVNAYALAHDSKEHGSQAWTARLLGEMHAHGDARDVEQAENTTTRPSRWPTSSACARSWPTATCGLGTLYGTTGQREQAQAELSAAIDYFASWR